MNIQQMSKDALRIEKEGGEAHALAVQDGARSADLIEAIRRLPLHPHKDQAGG